MKDYYQEIDKALKRFENLQYPIHSIEWITNRIDWCFRFKHITEKQMNALADRAIQVLKIVNLY